MKSGLNMYKKYRCIFSSKLNHSSITTGTDTATKLADVNDALEDPTVFDVDDIAWNSSRRTSIDI